MTSPFDFKRLNEQSSQLNNTTGTPLVQTDLGVLGDGAARITHRFSSTPHGDYAKNKGMSSMAQQGIDTSTMNRNLTSLDIDMKNANDATDQLRPTDVAATLQVEYEVAIISAIQQAQLETTRQLALEFEERSNKEWDDQRLELLNTMGFKQGRVDKELRSFSLQSPARLSSSPVSGFVARSIVPTLEYSRTALTEKMLQYARKIHALNAERNGDRTNKLVYPLAAEFLSVAQQTERDLSQVELVDAWELVRAMVGEKSSGNPSENLFYNRPVQETKGLLRAGALSFMQEQYKKVIHSAIVNNPEQAQRGGKPSFLLDVRAFITLKFNHRPGEAWPDALGELDSDRFPIWPQLYFLIRCGEYQEAEKLAFSFASQLGNLCSYLQSYTLNSGRLSDQAWGQIVTEYDQLARRNASPFKLIVYNLLGRCDVSDWTRFRDILISATDYVWYKLMLSYEEKAAIPVGLKSHEYRVAMFQQEILQYGPEHFTAGNRSPLSYFIILLQSQLFEHAIDYLLTTPYSVEAVHFAIALNYYGALSVISLPQGQLASLGHLPVEMLSKNPLAFNFVRMLRDYTAAFSKTDVLDAMQYMWLIYSPTVRNLCLKDLIIDSQEYEAILGARRPDGTTKEGAIRSLVDPQTLKDITRLVAADLERTGKFEDAVKMFDLGQDYERALSVLTGRMSHLVVNFSPERERIYKLADQLHQQYSPDGFKFVSDRRMVAAFESLRNLAGFFTLANAKKWEQALNYLDTLNLLPVTMEQTLALSENFKKLDKTISQVYSELLNATMNVISARFQEIKSGGQTASLSWDQSASDRTGREVLLDALRIRATALANFVGMAQYRLSSDTSARLIRFCSVDLK